MIASAHLDPWSASFSFLCPAQLLWAAHSSAFPGHSEPCPFRPFHGIASFPCPTSSERDFYTTWVRFIMPVWMHCMIITFILQRISKIFPKSPTKNHHQLKLFEIKINWITFIRNADSPVAHANSFSTYKRDRGVVDGGCEVVLRRRLGHRHHT